jgi:transcriptional regulator with XRE-family HTH domain
MTSTLPPAEANRVPVHPPYGRGVPEAPLGSPLRGPSRPPTLTEARLRSGLTMTELARALHISRPTLSLWEKGRRRPARSLWPRLAAVLGLELAEVAALFADHPPARLDGRPLPSLSMVRRRSGMTQRELAGPVGVAPTTLAMWESARVRVAPGMADQLARVLDTDLASLAALTRLAAAADPRPLRRLRKAAGMSQREAATYLGIALGTLARYEAGERCPPVAVARRMADVYRRPVVEVLDHCGIELAPLPPGPQWRTEDVPTGIRAARIAAGLTKVGLGSAVGRSGQAVRAWETGRARPGLATCRRLEQVLGLLVGTISLHSV